MKIDYLNPAGLSKPTGYSHVTVVTAGRLVHVAGQVSLNGEGQVVGRGDLAAQAEQVYQNLSTALAAAGAGLKDVIKVVTYVVNLSPDKVVAVRTARNRHLGDGPYPASTMVGVTSLVNPDLLIEVEAVAAIS